MANNIRGITVEIGGDTTKLGKAIADVEKKSNTLSKELTDINKLLKFEPGNVDLLTQKQGVLSEQIETTAKKLQILKEAEADVQAQFERGEVSEEQVRALQREIISTTSKMEMYERASQETANQLENLGEGSKDAGNNIDKLSKDAKKTGDNLDEAGDKASNFGEKMQKAGSVAAKGIGAVATAAGAVVGALATATGNASAYADEMLTMSTVTGISTDNLQAFSYASELVDVDLETLTKSMAKNIKSMSSASDGSKAYAEAYKQLGISVTDSNGNLKDSEAVYWEAIDALGKMTNETERDALAMQLFGKSAQELNPLIEAGSEKMQELTKEAKDVGAVMSGESLDALGAFDDSMQRLAGGANATKNALGGVLLPELQLVVDTGSGLLNDFTKNLNATGGGLAGLTEVIGSMSGEIGSTIAELLGQLIASVADVLPALIQVAMSLVSTLATTIISSLPQLLTTGVQIILTLINGLTSAIPLIINSITSIIPQLVGVLTSSIPLLIEGAISLFMALCTAIPQVLPPLISALPVIITTIINSLLGAIPQLIESALLLLMGVIDAIPLLIELLVPMIPDIVYTIALGLLDSIPLLLDASVELMSAIVQAIPLIIVELVKATPKIVDTIINYMRQLPGKLWTILKSVVTNYVKWISELHKTAKDGFVKVRDAVITVAKQLPSKIKSAIWSAISTVTTWGSNMLSKAKSAMSKVVSGITSTLKTIPSKIKSIGGDVVAGIWNGINNKVGWIKSKISGFKDQVLKQLKAVFKIKSPSQLMRDEVGTFLAEGISVGLTESNAPKDAIDKVKDDVLNGVNDINGVTLNRQLETTFKGSVKADNNIESKLDTIIEKLKLGSQIVLDTGTLVGETVDAYDNALSNKKTQVARGWA